MANPSTLGAKIKNPNYNDQVKEDEKNKKNATKPHSKQRECVRKKTYSLARTIHIPQNSKHFFPSKYTTSSNAAQVSKNIYCDVAQIYMPIFKQLNNLK